MEIIEINNNFKEEVLESDKKVLVDFYANWCGPCKMLRPILEEYAQESSVKVASVNVDDEQDLAMKYEVSSIPCLVLFENGKEIKRSVGLVSLDDIKSLVGK